MGTSQSSKGSPSGVPMVPPWVPAFDTPEFLSSTEPLVDVPDTANQASPPEPEKQQPVTIAPSGRFKNARLNLGEFARSGNHDSMRRGLAEYVHIGYGGSATATRRLGATVQDGKFFVHGFIWRWG